MALAISGSASEKNQAGNGYLTIGKSEAGPPQPELRRRLPRFWCQVNLRAKARVSTQAAWCRARIKAALAASGSNLSQPCRRNSRVIPPFAVQAHRSPERARRACILLAGARDSADQRGQRDRSQGFQLQLQRIARDSVVLLLGDLPVPRRLHAAAQRARAHRRHLEPAVEARADVDRYSGHVVFPAADGDSAHVALLARLRRCLSAQ